MIGSTEHSSVPERKLVKTMQVDGGHNVRHLWSGDVELGEQFDFAAGNARINVQLPRDC